MVDRCVRLGCGHDYAAHGVGQGFIGAAAGCRHPGCRCPRFRGAVLPALLIGVIVAFTALMIMTSTRWTDDAYQYSVAAPTVIDQHGQSPVPALAHTAGVAPHSRPQTRPGIATLRSLTFG